MSIPQNLTNKRKTGQTTVGTTAVPITKIDDTSSASTSFTKTAVRDSNPWNVANVEVGDVAVTSDGYMGLITTAPGASDTLEIAYGWTVGGRTPHPLSNIKPTDGSTVTIHRISRCSNLIIQSLVNNGANIFIGRNGDADSSDYKLLPGQDLPIYANEGRHWVDVTQIYAEAASGSQTIAWAIQGG